VGWVAGKGLVQSWGGEEELEWVVLLWAGKDLERLWREGMVLWVESGLKEMKKDWSLAWMEAERHRLVF